MNELDALTDAVIRGKRDEAIALTKAALEAGETPLDIVDRKLVPGMAIVGERFKNNEIFVPEMLIAARAMKAAMAVTEPLLLAEGVKPKYTAIIGTVQGDLHDIGKNLVGIMWKGANINVVDLGTDVSPERFVAAIEEHQPDIVGLSALLTTTMPAIAKTVEAIRNAGISNVKVLVGGAPVTREYADEIGADGYASDAGSAVEAALALVGSD